MQPQMHYHAHMFYTQPYRDAVAIQKVVKAAAVEKDVPRKELSGLARAFVELEMLKLRLRMKPAPKPIDVSEKARPHKPTHIPPSENPD